MISSYPVQPAIVVIPNGGDKNVLRLNLRVTPFRPDPAGGASSLAPIALEAWPDAVAAIANGKFRIDLATVDTVTTIKNNTVTVGQYAPLGFSGSAANGAMRLWQQTFSAIEVAQLWDELAKPEPPDPVTTQQAASARLAPRLDSATLCQALIETRARSLVRCIDALTGPHGAAVASRVAPPKSLDAPITEHEAWALPVPARGALAKVRESELASQRRRDFCSRLASFVPEGADRLFWHDANSHAELDAMHCAEQVMNRFDPGLDAAVKATRPEDPFELIASRVESLALVLNAPTTTAKASEDAPDPSRDVRRKLTAILNYPTVAKYLGMSFDIQIPRTEWAGALKRLGNPRAVAVSASFGSAATDLGTTWTAYVDLPAIQDGPPGYFGPADPAELGLAPESDRKFIRGMLDLGAPSKHSPGSPRYALEVVDPMPSFMRHTAFSARQHEASLASTPFDDEQPEIGGRGIALLDRDCVEDAHAAKQRDDDLQRATATKLLFAGDLVNGYRPMMGIALRNNDALNIPSDRWRSLVARKITYGATIDDTFVRTSLDAEREHGHVKTIASEQNGQSLLFQELFVWTGDSLGVPSHNAAAANELVADAATDLPVDITYDLPQPAPGIGLLPLREGRAYVVGVSACFLNGCGPTIADSVTAHANATRPKPASATATRHVLGAKDGGAFRYVRCERIPPPVILLPDQSELVTTRHIERLKGENLTTLVIRQEDGNRAQRYLYPARIAFDRAEQQDMFGSKDDDEPEGAFQRVGLTRTASGDFPRAVDGKVDSTDPKNDPKAKNSRGPVAQFADPDDVQADPYYPDSYCQGVWARFTANVPASGATLSPMTKPASYRKATEPAVSARPVMLELKPGKTTDPRRAWIDVNDKVSPDQPNGYSLNKIAIALAPATIVDIALDSDFDPAAALAGHLLSAPLMAAWGMNHLADIPKASTKLAKALTAGRIDDLQGKSVLRLVHAVQKPLIPARSIQLVPVLVTVAPEGKSSPTNPSWQEIIDTNSSAGAPFSEWSQPGGATCFFTGSVGLDAPSTGALGLDATWHDFEPQMVTWDRKTNSWIEQPAAQSGRLFSLTKLESDINRPNSVSEDEVSLVLDNMKKPRNLAFSFRDGRARSLRTRLMAVSRFAEYYDVKNPTGNVPGEAGDCERASTAWQQIWIPCTYRPSAFDIKRVTPWFTYHQTGEQGEQEYTFSRDISYRVEIGRDGFTSGEDEKLALVFPSGDPDICDYAEETLKPFASCLTRWGRDPLHYSPVPQRNISPARFQGSVGPPVNALRLLPGADPVDGSTSTAKPISATALPFKLILDPKTGTYYSEIEIAPTSGVEEAYMPFVQLGLARYQEHSVKGLELSLPVGTTIQLFPRRVGKIKFRRRSEGQRFSLQLSGQVDPRSKYHSVLDVTALVRVDNGHERPRWIAQVSGGKIAKLEGLKPNADGWTVAEFKMPKDRYFSDNWLGVLIEEYEVYRDEQGNEHKRIVYGQIVDFQQATHKPPP